MSLLMRKHVEGGYCIQTDGGIGTSFCALEAGQCNLEQQEWRSSRQAFSAGRFNVCVSRTEVEKVYLGQCGDGCAADAESCGDGDFEQAGVSNGANPDCMVEKAAFGNCDGRCVWSKDSCENDETYHIPGVGTGKGSGSGAGSGGGGGKGNGQGNEGGENECSCDKVQVGGCKTPDAPIFCAVAADACDDFQTYLTPTEVENQEQVSCFLCREESAPGPTSAPVGDPAVDSSNETELSNKASMGAIIGGAVVGGIVIMMLIFLLDYRRKKKAKENMNSSPPTPPKLDPETFQQDDVSEMEDPTFS